MAGLLQFLQQVAGRGPTMGGFAGGTFDMQGNRLPDPPSNEIVVEGRIGQQEGAFRPPVFDVPDRPEVDPRYVLNDARVAPHPEDMQEIVPRKGMFGVKGTLRDILGTVGDAFLVQSGNDPVYRPRRQMEQQGDAMLGFGSNPLQAIERLAAAGFPEEAQELYEQHQNAELRRAQMESLDANRQSLMSDRQFENTEKGLDRALRWAAGGLPYENIVAGSARYGITPEMLGELGITPDMSDEARRAFASGDMRVYQQEQLPRQDRRLDISQQNADSQRISATRPRATPQPRAQTDSERYVQIMDKDPSDRTRGEQAWAERYREGTSGRGSRREGRTPLPSSSSGSSSRFRILN